MENILIYGGTFNPVHIGHLRMAIEAWQVLGEKIQKTEFVPAHIQPLKIGHNILPFDLRVSMLVETLKNHPGFSCNEVESDRSGPSYTYDTLINYPGTEEPGQRFFLLGSEDFEQLPLWHNGMQLPNVANIVVAPRSKGMDVKRFELISRNFWGDQIAARDAVPWPAGEGACLTLHNGSQIYYIDIPYLEISSSAIRRDWLENRNIDYLVPGEAAKIMTYNRERIKKIWEGNK